MDVLEVTKKFMRDPIRILVKKEELTLEGIKQFYINVEREVRGKFNNLEGTSCTSTVLKPQKLGLQALASVVMLARYTQEEEQMHWISKRLGWTSFLMSSVLVWSFGATLLNV